MPVAGNPAEPVVGIKCVAAGCHEIDNTVEGAAMALLDTIVGDSAELVTVVAGADSDSAVTDQIVGWLGDHRGDIHVDVHHGGQPLYPYLFGVE